MTDTFYQKFWWWLRKQNTRITGRNRGIVGMERQGWLSYLPLSKNNYKCNVFCFFFKYLVKLGVKVIKILMVIMKTKFRNYR